MLGWKIEIDYQKMSFIHAQFNQYFTPKKIKSELQIYFNF